jgi:hypothetical protein
VNPQGEAIWEGVTDCLFRIAWQKKENMNSVNFLFDK